MTLFSGDEDRIIRRMIRNYSDADIARELRRSSDQIKRRMAELGIKRSETARFRNRTKTPVAEPTLEEIEERKRQMQESWGERERRKRAKGETSVEYEFPVYRISMEA